MQEGLRISDAYNQRNSGRTHGGIILVGSDLTEPNVTQRTKGYTLDELSEYVKSGIPSPPEGVSFVVAPIIDIEGNTIIARNEASVNWDGEIVNYSSGVIFQSNLPSDGLERLDVVYLLESGMYGVAKGDASQNPVTKPIPANSLYVGIVKWTSEGGVPGGGFPTFTDKHTADLYDYPLSYLRYFTTEGLGFPAGVGSFFGYAETNTIAGYAEARLTLYRSNGEVYHQGRGWNNGVAFSEWKRLDNTGDQATRGNIEQGHPETTYMSYQAIDEGEI